MHILDEISVTMPVVGKGLSGTTFVIILSVLERVVFIPSTKVFALSKISLYSSILNSKERLSVNHNI